MGYITEDKERVMVGQYKLFIENDDVLESLKKFFRSLLREQLVDFLLIPQESKTGELAIPALVNNGEEIENVLCLTPYLMLNSASVLSQLTIDKPGSRIGAVMRSCEIRAAVELYKLKQIHWDNLLVIGVDCLGTFETRDYIKIVRGFPDRKELTKKFINEYQPGKARQENEPALRPACRGCEFPVPENSDIAIHFLGCDVNKEMFVQTSDKIGQDQAEKLSLTPCEDNSAWIKAVEVLTKERSDFRETLMGETLAGLQNTNELLKVLESCRRCYNCRRACPICYCRECVFDSLVFEHKSNQYMSWAKKRGKIRMPSDTLLFHLTRLNHMVISCVGCGQCTSACPNDVPVAKMFKSIGAQVQGLFNYKPGKDRNEEIPQSTFKEDEFPLVGK